MQIPRWSTDTGVAWLVLSTLLGLLGLARPVHAAEFSCAAGDVPCLIEAINVANTNGEANTITLAAGLYTLTAVDNDTDGPTGLPSVTGPLTLRGAGADSTVLERAAGAPPFRLLHVGATGTLTLDGLTLQGGNVAGLADGGGVLNWGTLTVTHSLLWGHAARGGGGIYTLGPLRIMYSTLSGNVATSGGGIGTDQGSLTITNSTLNGNVANSRGGGLSSLGSFGTTITNSTLHGNIANGSGGGIDLSASTLTLTNSTVSGNLASQGGGLYIASGGGLLAPGSRASLGNTILARNAVSSMGTGPDCITFGGSRPGQAISQGHNLIGDPTGCTITFAAGDLTGDPGLGPFIGAGTPAQGYLPLRPTSQAINAGDQAACPPTDQLGQLRVTPCDIGAVEFAPVTVTLGLNQATFRAGETLRVALGIHHLGPTVTTDAYLGVLLPDAVTVFFVSSLAPLDGVVTRLDADPRTFAPLAASYEFPSGEDVTVDDFFVYPVTGGESSGSYTIFTLLTPPGAFADGQVDTGDLLGLTLQPFTVSP